MRKVPQAKIGAVLMGNTLMPLGPSSTKSVHNRKTLISVFLLLTTLTLFSGCSLTRISSVNSGHNTTKSLFKQGIVSFRQFTPKSYSQAVNLFRQATKLDPSNCLYHLHLTESLLFLALERRLNEQSYREHWNEAVSILDKIRTSNLDSYQTECSGYESFVLRLESVSLLDEFKPGGDPSAINKIAEAVELNPQDPLNWFVRWKLNPSTRRQENAILKAASLSNDLALIHYELGNYWLIKSDYQKARKSFEHALKLSPAHFRSYIGLAQAISAADNGEDVEHLYLKAVELDPEFIEGRILLGDYFAGLEETESAVSQYKAVIEQNPNYAIAHLRLGVTLLQTGDFDGAEPSFERAIELNRSNFEAYYYLGNVWLSRRKLDRAMELYEESLKYVLNFPEALYALGSVHFRKGNIQQALTYFQSVIELNQRHADAYFSRAAILTKRKQYSRAIDDYNRALSLYDQQLIRLGKSIAELDSRGLSKKADLERRRRIRIELSIERTLNLKMESEDLQLRGP